MNEQSRKTLSIVRKSSPSSVAAETVNEAANETVNTPRPAMRTGKRLITRDQLPHVQKPGKLKARPSVPNRAPPCGSRAPEADQPTSDKALPPSVLEAKALNAQLNRLPVWYERQPLVLGIEQQIFQYFAEQGISVSRRVMQRLLHYQTRNRLYLQQVQHGGARYHLDGTVGGEIQTSEREHASRMLAALGV